MARLVDDFRHGCVGLGDPFWYGDAHEFRPAVTRNSHSPSPEIKVSSNIMGQKAAASYGRLSEHELTHCSIDIR